MHTVILQLRYVTYAMNVHMFRPTILPFSEILHVWTGSDTFISLFYSLVSPTFVSLRPWRWTHRWSRHVGVCCLHKPFSKHLYVFVVTVFVHDLSDSILLVRQSKRFYFSLDYLTWEIKAVWSFEIPVSLYQSTRHNVAKVWVNSATAARTSDIRRWYG
jgi:hypothetical protein